MKNKDVAIAFIDKRTAQGSNLRSDGLKLYSYSSLLTEWKNGKIVVYSDIANYSQSSKVHYYYLRTNAPAKLIEMR